MGCLHNAFNGGCTYFDPNEKDENLGCDDDGHCMVEDDEYPSDGCTYYSSNGDELEGDDELDDIDTEY